jgi:hypothetical protein
MLTYATETAPLNNIRNNQYPLSYRKPPNNSWVNRGSGSPGWGLDARLKGRDRRMVNSVLMPVRKDVREGPKKCTIRSCII